MSLSKALSRVVSAALQSNDQTRPLAAGPAIFAMAALVTLGGAQMVGATTSGPQFAAYLAQNERGGPLHDRLVRLNTLRADNAAVAFRDRFCNAACTMFRGLPQTCGTPETALGLQGVSRSHRLMEPGKTGSAAQRHPGLF
ncbi:hypothetical protein [Epibacterium sp. Ofav1-8]|uniref:hypothetical protein n=1 Tax=Epibacterium sp. Ofav1-8 TaxID=2917735 RepID=UPI001EF6ED89|nr:hypothetical protein [Epibacterium sp. Ofav1-8]MCG7624042.1 hypothetical protein [Epibacterium sp. Ofav1-8]